MCAADGRPHCVREDRKLSGKSGGKRDRERTGIKAKAKTNKKTIVLPETEDIRTYEAAEAVLKEGTANLILVGSEEEIAKNKGSFDISGAKIVDPATYEKTDAYIAKLVELRQKKGMTEEQARELLLTNYLYYGVMMVKMKDADGMVSGI